MYAAPRAPPSGAGGDRVGRRDTEAGRAAGGPPRERRAGRLWPVNRRLPAAAPAHRPFLRRALAVGAGLAVVGVTAGCQVNNPLTTNIKYAPADGVQADVGDLAIRDLVLVGDGSGPSSSRAMPPTAAPTP